MKWDIVLFDLDGTLTDSGQGVGNAVLYAINEMGFAEPNPEVLRKYLGPPLWSSFREFAGMNETETKLAVELYRKYYNEIGAYENNVYSGIPELLTKLNNQNKRLAVATSKVDYAAINILRHFNLDHHFEVIAGGDEHGTIRGTKALVIAHALDELSLCDGTSIIMIGDREHDVHGAAEHELQTIGVNWGYAEDGELSNAGAIEVVDSVAQLADLLLD
jgi:phosphoglycolate phosphatase